MATSTPEPDPWLLPDVPDAPDVVVKYEQKMRDVVPRVAPDARISEIGRTRPTDGPQLGFAGPNGTREFIEIYGLQYSVTLGPRGGGLFIDLRHALGGYDHPFAGCELYSFGECEETTTSDGKRMQVHKTVSPVEYDPTTPQIMQRVIVDCGNGVAVQVAHSNHLAGAPNSDAPPLTLEQLKQMAICPAL